MDKATVITFGAYGPKREKSLSLLSSFKQVILRISLVYQTAADQLWFHSVLFQGFTFFVV